MVINAATGAVFLLCTSLLDLFDDICTGRDQAGQSSSRLLNKHAKALKGFPGGLHAACGDAILTTYTQKLPSHVLVAQNRFEHSLLMRRCRSMDLSGAVHLSVRLLRHGKFPEKCSGRVQHD